jgi:hypothetical protein
MKKFSLVIAMACFALAVQAQDVKFPPLDPSPADLAYFPANATQKAAKGGPVLAAVKVSYSRPAKKGREVFGTLEAFGTVYRLGANESSEIKFFKPVTVGGKAIAAGSYGLFAIPNKDTWTIIISKDTDRWGAYAYDESKDLVRVTVPVKTLDTVVENLSMVFTPAADGATLNIGWDKTAVALPIQFK